LALLLYGMRFTIFFSCLIIFSSYGTASGSGIPYTASFEGISDKDLLSEIYTISDIVKLKSSPPASLNILEKRALGDREKIRQLLRSRGFFKSSVDIEIDSKKEPVIIIFRINKGPGFILKSFKIRISQKDLEEMPKLPDSNEIGLVSGKPFSNAAVLDGREEILFFFRKNGFPFVKIENLEIVADHKDETVDVTFWIDTGPESLFGKTVIIGLVSVDESFVFDKIPWKEGDRYDANLFAEVRETLTDLGLFATVRVIEGESLDENSGLPIIIEVTERKHRSFGAGVKYMTDEGSGVKLLWEHRNMFHRGVLSRTNPFVYPYVWQRISRMLIPARALSVQLLLTAILQKI